MVCLHKITPNLYRICKAEKAVLIVLLHYAQNVHKCIGMYHSFMPSLYQHPWYIENSIKLVLVCHDNAKQGNTFVRVLHLNPVDFFFRVKSTRCHLDHEVWPSSSTSANMVMLPLPGKTGRQQNQMWLDWASSSGSWASRLTYSQANNALHRYIGNC